MQNTTAVRLLLAGSVALASSAAAQGSIRCDGGIVSAGDSRLDLLGKCGPPTLQELEPVAPAGMDDPALVMMLERWSYDFGPARFIQVVILQGGQVIAVERGSYGYLPVPAPGAPGPPLIPRARCENHAFGIGDRTIEVLVRCGAPVFRDFRPGPAQGPAVIEVWTYDFGPHSLVRYLEFERGRLVRIQTGSYGYSR